MAIRLSETQLNHFVGQQPQGPVVVPLRRFATRYRYYMGALPFIQLWLGSRPGPFL